MVRLKFWSSGECGVTSLLPGSLWPGVVIPVRVPAMGQIDLFKNELYLIGACEKKNNIKTMAQKCKYKCSMNAIP